MQLRPVSMFLALALTASSFAAESNSSSDSYTQSRKAALELFNQKKDCVQNLSLVIKVSITPEGGNAPAQAQEQEQKKEVLATCIDPKGIFVTSLMEVDPASGLNGQVINHPMAGKLTLRASSEISDCKILLADGSEIEAEVVLKDEDADLAFIKVKKAPEKDFVAIDINNSVEPQILDELVVLSRLGKEMNRENSILRTEVIGISKKPRLRIKAPNGTVGTPLLTPEGKFVGINVITKPEELKEGSMPESIILPAKDILKAYKQLAK